MIPGEKVNRYRRAVQDSEKRENQILTERREEAWELARQAAALLREKYNATRIVVFGSLVKKEMFTPWSDVDIAAWGIAPEHTFKAIADILWMASKIGINLVDVNTCSANLLASIEHEGVDI
jgi:uncharacterized protein